MAMQTVKRRDSSPDAHLQSSLATEASLVEGQDVGGEDNQLLVRTHATIPRFSRERLIQQFREGKLQRHDEIDFGDPVGDKLGGPQDLTRDGIE